MAGNSKIEWTDKTWNPVTGCTKVSQGCKFCYAETFYERFHGKGSFKNVICHDDRIDMPIRWRKPSMIFVNSMSDLFHEDVPFSFIHNVINTIAACPQHTFQVLTKRADRMLEYYHWFRRGGGYDFSLPDNLWLGVSAEDTSTFNDRIFQLINIPAKVRFISCEPLLGPITLYPLLNLTNEHRSQQPGSAIDWVIVGGESGRNARPINPEWVRSLRDECAAANVPFFFKQWGEWMPTNFVDVPARPCPIGHWNGDHFNTCHLNEEDWPDVINMSMVGKKAAGRTLDGVIHNEWPVDNFKQQSIATNSR